MREHGRRASWTSWAGVLVLSALLLGACTSPKNALGGTTSPCFRALPVAHDVAGKQARLLGVRFLSLKELDAALAHTHQRLVVSGPSGTAVNSPLCAVGYSGAFEAARVLRPWPPGRRRSSYLLVLVDVKTLRVHHSVLLRRPPLQLSKL